MFSSDEIIPEKILHLKSKIETEMHNIIQSFLKFNQALDINMFGEIMKTLSWDGKKYIISYIDLLLSCLS